MRHVCVLTFVAIAIGILGTSAADEDIGDLVGLCVNVPDGDDIVIRDAGNLDHNVHLGGIDAPEGKQEFAKQSQENLAKLVVGKTVRLKQTDVDGFGRLIGVVFLDEKNINQAQVRDGCAWRYIRFDKPGAYTAAEKEAREKRRGLWAAKNPIPPWEFVKKEKVRRNAQEKK